MNAVLTEISKLGIVPVVALDDAKDARLLAQALCEGGLPCGYIPHRSGRRSHSNYGLGIPEYAHRRRYGSDN